MITLMLIVNSISNHQIILIINPSLLLINKNTTMAKSNLNKFHLTN